VRPGPAARSDELPGVVGRVRPDHDDAARSGLAGGVDRFGDQAGRAPPGGAALPPRNRAAATTGAAAGLDTVATRALSPRTSSDFDAILACPNAAPCLPVP